MVQGLEFDNTLGANLIGLVIGSVLYGVVCSQAYKYFQSFPKDPFIAKATVISLVILETVHTILITHVTYYYMVTNYMNPLALLQTVWSSLATVTAISLIVFIAHTFYAVQIYHLGKSFCLPGLIITLGLTQLGFCVALSVVGSQTSMLQIPLTSKKFLIIVPLTVGCAGDILCAGALSYYLYINRSGIKRTDSLIWKIMTYAIGTGAISSVVIIAVLIMLALQPLNFIYISIFETLSKLYAVSILVRLNSRTPSSTSGSGIESAIVVSGISASADGVGVESANILTSFRATVREYTPSGSPETSFTTQSQGLKDQDSDRETKTLIESPVWNLSQHSSL
ncbi:hypothetical protein E1B28_011965 [Marasmius oreades]|uniref:DUF6534 domain-containing protein n=1 Tax=Marasmius oreades TaxID=181124 RepID=A0A9P7UMQ4_9AGAR|nr:uncharacterized protein E1B28_011965 [Marasmius oreades]KAG7087917.1 hypothetical protein E1B28_011965 [Marasmius oreades]